MKARIALVMAVSMGLAACQSDDLTPTGAVPMNAAVSQEDLFTLVPNPALNNSQQAFLSNIRSRPMSGEVHVARITGAAAGMLHAGKSVRLNVAPGRQVVAFGEGAEQRGASDISWGGPLQGEPGSVQMVLTSVGVTATIHAPEGMYRVEPLGGGLHAITRINQAGFPQDHPAEHPTGAYLPAVSPEPSPFEVAGDDFQASMAASTQRVLVVYTASAASATADIGGLIQLAVDETNGGYSNSAVGITSSKAHVAQVTYSETGRSFSTHVNYLKGTTDGYMDNVHTLRNTYTADLVVLVVNDSEACGMAAAIKATATTAFAAAHYSCITGYYSFAHEIGHLQGARHDRAVDASTSPYTYGHGYVSPTKNWRTIMAYGNACSNCTRVKYWSNPNITYPSTGQAMGTATYEDNARVLNNTAATVAAFR